SRRVRADSQACEGERQVGGQVVVVLPQRPQTDAGHRLVAGHAPDRPDAASGGVPNLPPVPRCFPRHHTPPSSPSRYSASRSSGFRSSILLVDHLGSMRIRPSPSRTSLARFISVAGETLKAGAMSSALTWCGWLGSPMKFTQPTE